MFGNLTIKSRLTILISFMAALLLVIGGIGLSGMSKTEAGLKTVYEDRTVPLMDLGRIIDMANRTRTNATVAATAPWADVAIRPIRTRSSWTWKSTSSGPNTRVRP